MPIVASGVVIEPHVLAGTVSLRGRRAARVRPLLTATVAALATAFVVVVAVVGWTVSSARPTDVRVADRTGVLSDADRLALGLPDSASTMFDPGAATAVVAAFQRALGGAALAQISLYPDSAVAVVAAGNGLEQHVWTDGRIGDGSPRASNGDLASLAFDASAVDWSAIAALADRASVLTGVAGGTVSHVIVDRSTFDPRLPITIRVSVTGPTGSGYVEATAAGDVLAVY
ncbi:MAG: hypothetical protein AB7L17_17630 [Ilumatobacteraceae bacterium]